MVETATDSGLMMDACSVCTTDGHGSWSTTPTANDAAAGRPVCFFHAIQALALNRRHSIIFLRDLWDGSGSLAEVVRAISCCRPGGIARVVPQRQRASNPA